MEIIVDRTGKGKYYYAKVDPWEAGIIYICFKAASYYVALDMADQKLQKYGYDPMQLIVVDIVDIAEEEINS